MSFKIRQWEIMESVIVQRILKALEHNDSEITKCKPGSFIEYVITYKNNYFKLHLSRQELIEAYSATQKYNDLLGIRIKIMAIILGSIKT